MTKPPRKRRARSVQEDLEDLIHHIDPSEIPSLAERGFQDLLDSYNHNMLIDSPMGRSVFAWGASTALMPLQDRFTKAELERVAASFEAFMKEYMTQSRRAAAAARRRRKTPPA
jgi:hypothetical protein